MKKMILFVMTLLIFLSPYANVAAAEMEPGRAEQTRYYMKNAVTGEVREMS